MSILKSDRIQFVASLSDNQKLVNLFLSEIDRACFEKNEPYLNLLLMKLPVKLPDVGQVMVSLLHESIYAELGSSTEETELLDDIDEEKPNFNSLKNRKLVDLDDDDDDLDDFDVDDEEKPGGECSVNAGSSKTVTPKINVAKSLSLKGD